MNRSIEYYNNNAESFFEQTATVDMSPQYERFLSQIPIGGWILDAGCGSGRDSLAFLQRGYRVESFDASLEMCRLASRHLGREVTCKRFDEVTERDAYDGIWACASLLHVPRAQMDSVLDRLAGALKASGVLFVSFKLKEGEWEHNDGREFNCYDEKSFRELMVARSDLVLDSLWTSFDRRPSRQHEQWLNALIRKV